MSLTNDTTDGVDGNNTDSITKDASLTLSALDTDATRTYQIGTGADATAAATAAGEATASATYTMPTEDGIYNVIVKDTDGAGNTSTANVTFTLDTTLTQPTVALTQDTGTAGDNFTKNAALKLNDVDADATRTFKVASGTTAELSATNAASATASASYIEPTEDGIYTVIVTDIDKAGNSKTASLTFTLDKTVATPSISLANDTARNAQGNLTTNGDMTTSDATIAVVGAETDATIEYAVNSGSGFGAWLSAQNYAAAVSANGNYTVKVRQTDKVGNVSAESNSLSFTKDSIAPTTPSMTITDTFAADGITNDPVVTVGLSGDTAMWQYSVNAGATWVTGSSNQFTLDEGFYATGAIQVRAFDAAGNMSSVTSSTRSYTLDLTPPDANTSVGINGVSYINGTGLNASNYYEFGDTIRLNFTEKLSSISSISVTDSTGNVEHSTGLHIFTNQTGKTYAQVTLEEDGSRDPFIQAGDTVTIVGVDFVGNSATMTFNMV